MSLRDFLILMSICAVWAANNVISRYVVADLHVPPMVFAALRFALVAIVTVRWLFPAPRPMWRLILVALLMGGVNFTLMFIGLQTATSSSSAIVLQTGVPMSILLSVIFLKEELRLRRIVGIVLAIAGAVIVIWNPAGLTLSTGLLWIVAACFTYSVGAVMLRAIPTVRPLTLQAWVGFASVWPLVALSAVFEHGQAETIRAHFWPFAAAIGFSALVTSVVAHTVFYSLIQRYDASLLQPLTLMTPLLTIFLGVVLMHDHFDGRMALGAAITLLGVLVIVLRPIPLLARLRGS